MRGGGLGTRPMGRGGGVLLSAFLFLTAGPAPAADDLAAVYQAAKAEGEVSIIGPPNVRLREALSQAFTADHPGITVKYVGMPGGNQVIAKMKAERAAGLSSTDAVISGTITAISQLKPENLIRPFDDLLVDRQARDPSKWMGGGLFWSDPEKSVLVLLAMITPIVVVNADLVKPGEITSDADLLDPKWKGRIASNDPAIPGNAAMIYRRFYHLHGADYLRRLSAQKPSVIKDLRQVVDGVAKGNYAIAIGSSPLIINQFLAQGVKSLRVVPNWEWRDTMVMSSGFGDVYVPAQTAHPAASKLFVNWLITHDGQLALSRGLGYPSRRIDVPVDHVPEYLRAKPGVRYIESDDERFIAGDEVKRTMAVLKEIEFGKQ